jgi:hypothetical protein
MAMIDRRAAESLRAKPASVGDKRDSGAAGLSDIRIDAEQGGELMC